MLSFNVNPADHAAGIRAYNSEVRPCPTCGKPTNTLYGVEGGRIVLGCSQECADKRNLSNI